MYLTRNLTARLQFHWNVSSNFLEVYRKGFIDMKTLSEFKFNLKLEKLQLYVLIRIRNGNKQIEYVDYRWR